MRPGDRIELRGLYCAYYGHYMKRIPDWCGGGEASCHVYHFTDEQGRFFVFEGSAHLMVRAGAKCALKATFKKYGLITGRRALIIQRPKLIGEQLDQMRLI